MLESTLYLKAINFICLRRTYETSPVKALFLQIISTWAIVTWEILLWWFCLGSLPILKWETLLLCWGFLTRLRIWNLGFGLCFPVFSFFKSLTKQAVKIIQFWRTRCWRMKSCFASFMSFCTRLVLFRKTLLCLWSRKLKNRDNVKVCLWVEWKSSCERFHSNLSEELDYDCTQLYEIYRTTIFKEYLKICFLQLLHR